MFFYNCSNDENNKTDKTLDSNTDSIFKDTSSKKEINIPIFEELTKIEKQFFPSEISRLIEMKNDTDFFRIIDNYSCKVDKNKELNCYFKLFWDDSGHKYLCVSCFKIDQSTKNISSYLYFLKNVDDNWQNVSNLLFPYFAVDIIKLKIEDEVKFGKIHLKEAIYAYKSEDCKSGFFVNFEKGNFILKKVYISENDTLIKTPFLELLWKDNILEIGNIIENTNHNLLSNNELERVNQYFTFEEALIDSDLVYILDISGQNINSLPKEIKHLKKLQILNLNDNNLEFLPSEIGELTNLQVLMADNNVLIELPEEIGELNFLEEISLANNQLTKLPENFKKLKNLRKLNINKNSFTSLPLQILNLDYLSLISAADNSINLIPSNISNLENLFFLNLSNNKIKSLTNELVELQHLKEINLTGNKLNMKNFEKIKSEMENTIFVY